MIPVMIVEDEFLVRAGLRTIINWEQHGFEIVAEAQNGEEALLFYRQYHPVIVITDIRLPKMDGIIMMKELRKKKEKVSFIVISAYDDFQYAKEAIGIGVANYFLKGNMDVEEFLKTLNELKLEHTIEERWDNPASQITLKELYLSKDSGNLLERCWKPVPDVAFLIYFCVQNANLQMLEVMVMDFFAHLNIRCVKLQAESGSWFLCTWENETEENVVTEMSHMFKRYVDEEIKITVSDCLYTYPDMREAVYSILLLHEYKENPSYRLRSSNEYEEKETLQNIRNTENSLVENLKFQKFDAVREYLEQLKYKVMESRCPSALFSSVYRLMGAFAEYDEELSASRGYEELMNSLSLEYIFQGLNGLISDLEEKKGEGRNIYVSRVKEYIEKNYREQIRIKDLSDYIHVSPNYLGKLFYTCTGEHLRDYINMVRLEKSKELLLSKKFQVSEVAIMVGVEDQRYFSKLFKKCYGISPKEYGR